MELPHYFVASRRRAGMTARPSAPLVHALDGFSLEVANASPVDVVVGVTAQGSLDFAAGREVRDRLTESALEAVHFHEVTPPSRRRVVRAQSLYLFDMQLVEQTASSPGLNDPAYVYGTLVGPVLGPSVPRAVQGQLTMTRGDLLQGFVSARPWAFRYPAHGRSSPCCFHALLPAERPEGMAQGHGLVLAYPLLPSELADEDMDNTSVVRLILADTIRALKVDLARNHRDKPWLARSLGRNEAHELALGEDADVSACLDAAARALTMLPDWPSLRATELDRRVGRCIVTASEPPNVPAHPHRPSPPPELAQAHVPPSPAPPRAAPRAVSRAPRVSEPPEWMRDFMASHAPGGHHVTWTRRAHAALASRTAEGHDADWREDFEQRESDSAPGGAANSERPEWMKDFEDE